MKSCNKYFKSAITTELYGTFWLLETKKKQWFEIGDLVVGFTKKLVIRMDGALRFQNPYVENYEMKSRKESAVNHS